MAGSIAVVVSQANGFRIELPPICTVLDRRLGAP
jgi:hypothetical protein